MAHYRISIRCPVVRRRSWVHRFTCASANNTCCKSFMQSTNTTLTHTFPMIIIICIPAVRRNRVCREHEKKVVECQWIRKLSNSLNRKYDFLYGHLSWHRSSIPKCFTIFRLLLLMLQFFHFPTWSRRNSILNENALVSDDKLFGKLYKIAHSGKAARKCIDVRISRLVTSSFIALNALDRFLQRLSSEMHVCVFVWCAKYVPIIINIGSADL